MHVALASAVDLLSFSNLVPHNSIHWELGSIHSQALSPHNTWWSSLSGLNQWAERAYRLERQRQRAVWQVVRFQLNHSTRHRYEQATVERTLRSNKLRCEQLTCARSTTHHLIHDTLPTGMSDQNQMTSESIASPYCVLSGRSSANYLIRMNIRDMKGTAYIYIVSATTCASITNPHVIIQVVTRTQAYRCRATRTDPLTWALTPWPPSQHSNAI